MSVSSSLSFTQDEKKIARQENWLFFKQWLQYPTQLGTLAPISARLANAAAALIASEAKEGKVIELGAGTGRLTRALLRHGIKSENLATIELDPRMHAFLEHTLPEVKSVCGDAVNLNQLLSKEWLKEVSLIVSVIPLMYLPEALRKKIVDAAFDVLPLDRPFFHVTYSPISPLKNMYPGLEAKRTVSKWVNLPPGFVWKYQRQ